MPFYEDAEGAEMSGANAAPMGQMPGAQVGAPIIAPWAQSQGPAVNAVPPGTPVQKGDGAAVAAAPAPKKVDTREIEYQKAMEEYEAKCNQHKENLQRATDALDEALDQYEDGKEQMRRQQYDWEKQWKEHLKKMKANIAELKKVKFEAPKKPA